MTVTILTFKRLNFKILCVWKNLLLIDRVQKFAETFIPQDLIICTINPKERISFRTELGYLNQSLKEEFNKIFN